MIRNLSSAIASIAIILFCSPAKADWSQQTATLDCNADTNSFIITFERVWNGDEDERTKISAQNRPAGYSYFPNGICSLSNGERVALSFRAGQAFPYGAGGADPDGFFTLSINDHYIYYDFKHYSGHGEERPHISSIKYENGRLEATGKDGVIDQTERLTSNHLTQQEIDSFWHDRRKESYRSSVPEYCKDMDFNALLKTVEFTPLDRSQLGASGFNLSSASTDMDNDGQNETVYLLSQQTHYFYGAVLVSFFANSEAEQKFIMPHTQEKLDFDQIGISPMDGLGAYSIALSNGTFTPRYQFNRPFRLNGKTYVVSWAHNRNDLPAATVSIINHDKSVSIMCNYPDIPQELERYE